MLLYSIKQYILKKDFILFLFATIIILCFFCNPIVYAKKEKIVFWYGATQKEQQAYKDMIAEFERQNPDIEVQGMLVPQQYVERKLILSIAGKVPPDVVRFYTHLGGEMMSRGGLEPIDDLIARDNINLSDFYEVGIKQNTYKGKLYGMPWVLSPYALFYNKELFRKAGLDPEKPPKNWEELVEYSKKLTIRNERGQLTQVGFANFLYLPNDFSMYLWQSNGELLSDNNLKAAFNSEEGIIAFRWMKGFLDNQVGGIREMQRFAANFKGATQDPFGQGSIAMRIDSPFRIPDLAKYFPNLDYAVAPIPYNKRRASEVVGNSLVIPKGSKNKEAAWKFIKFATSTEQMINICSVGGRIPARISASHSEVFYNDPILKTFIDQIPYGQTIPIVPGWQEVSETLARQIEQGLRGNKSIEQALNDAAEDANKILAIANEDLTKLPEISWQILGVISVIILILIIIVAALYIRKHTYHSKRLRKEAYQFLAFSSPWIIGFIVFTFGATIAALIFSFSKWDAISSARYIGFRNYTDMLTADPRFYKSLFVTFYYAIFSIPFALVGGLCVSLLMNKKLFGIRLFRTIYYMPVVITGVATSVLWQYIFNPTTGLLNRFLQMNVIPIIGKDGITFEPLWSTPPDWLLDPSWAMPAFIIMGLWSVGGSMIIYLAALQGVPEELYESATLDGANSWNSFWNVTLPLLTPAIFYQLVTGTMYSLQMFTQAYIMTNGGPEDATLFYALYLFRNAFEFMKLGYASAMAWILFIIVMIITLIQLKMAKRWVYYEGVKD
ncbi:MAG: extracellular solute-binding protein [Armatimonadota bacterium]